MPDLARIREDLAYFAGLLGQELAGWQRPDLGVLFLCIVAGRQMGKSRFAAVAALWFAVRRPGQLILLASASEEGAKRLLAMARSYARALPSLEASFEDDQLGLLTLSNGSQIRAIATSETAARGWSADVVFVDEAQLCPRAFVDALLPVITAREDAQVIFLGTGGVSEGAFFDMARGGELGAEDTRTVRWVARVAGGDCDAPWVRASVVEAARRSMSASRFAAEYRAEFASGGDVLFPLALLERQTADYRCETETLASLRPRSRGSLGVDWGERADRSAAVRAEFFAGTRVLGFSAVRRWAAGCPIPDVVDEIAGSPGHYSAIFSERNGLGAPASQYMEKAIRSRAPAMGGGRRPPRVVSWTGAEELAADRSGRRNRAPSSGARARRFHTHVEQVFTTAPMKAAGFGLARLMLEQDRLRIPAAATELRTELMHLRSELTASGVERIEAAFGHDDLAMAMLLALQPRQDRQKGGEAWRLRLADLSDPRRPVPGIGLSPVELARLTGETVRTGAGAEVPRSPVWQSIGGGEITAPDDLPIYEPPVSPQLREARERVAEALRGEGA
jgi:Helicase